MRLTFYSDVKEVPPRWIENLSTRLPANEKQKIHVVLFSDEQLKKANLGTLYAEGQQLEKSLVYWMQANDKFREENRRFYSYEVLDARRKLIYEFWDKARSKDEASLPKEYNDYLKNRFSDSGELASQLKFLRP